MINTSSGAAMWVLSFLFLVMSGCSSLLCGYGFGCDAYYQEQLDKKETEWNQWLGKTKDERIMKVGPSDISAPLSDGGEACEWRSGGVSGGGSYSANSGSSWVSSWEHHIVFTYDRDHIARAWSYHGSLGQRTSHDAKTANENRSGVKVK